MGWFPLSRLWELKTGMPWERATGVSSPLSCEWSSGKGSQRGIPGRDPREQSPLGPAPAEHPAAALQGADVPRPADGGPHRGSCTRARVGAHGGGLIPMEQGWFPRRRSIPTGEVKAHGRRSVPMGEGHSPWEGVRAHGRGLHSLRWSPSWFCPTH